MATQKKDDIINISQADYLFYILKDMKEDIKKLALETKNDIEKLDFRIDKLDARIDKLDDRINSNFKWLLSIMITLNGAILGVIAHGFHWI